jgi:hypothetical protein
MDVLNQDDRRSTEEAQGLKREGALALAIDRELQAAQP